MEGENRYKKWLWTEEEDRVLVDYVRVHGRGKWNRIAKMTGLKRSGKSCRLRWMNYLSPNVKRGDFSEEEDDLIIRLHKLLGNRWSLIAGRVPGRTDNQVKNHWNTHLCKKLGIKKLNAKAGASFKAHSSTKVEETHRLPMDSNTTILQSMDDKVDIGAMNAQDSALINACGASNEQAQSTGERCAESLWFSDYHLHLHSPDLMEFIDGFSLDHLIWQGL